MPVQGPPGKPKFLLLLKLPLVRCFAMAASARMDLDHVLRRRSPLRLHHSLPFHVIIPCLLQIFESFFNEAAGRWGTDTLYS
jgi:hypothetical protein